MVESRYTFSINLPLSLYQILINEAGRGKVSTFVREVLEEKFAGKKELEKQQKEQLKKRLITAYQREAEDKDLQKEMRIWEELEKDGLDDE